MVLWMSKKLVDFFYVRNLMKNTKEIYGKSAEIFSV
jgi:hypothetical protein